MAALVFLRRRSFIYIIAALSVLLCSALAQRGPAQLVTSALFCFNNKFVYNRCNGAYRLNESGKLNIPPEATDEFCNGACLSETQGLLNCVNSVFTRFIFNNGASIGNIRGMLNSACSLTSRRGNFNVGDYMGYGYEFSNSFKLLPKQTSVFVILMPVVWFLLLI